MIRLNCFMQVSAESLKAVKEAATKLTEASRAQDGCLDYDIFESCTRPGVLMFCESWRDQAALDAHMASEVFKTCVAEIEKHTVLHLNRFEK